jgi:hypothetical protein
MWVTATNVPLVSKPIAIICAILNLIIPGVGTLLAACQTKANYVSKTQMTIAFLQFITSLFLIGWLLALYWSYLIVTKAWKYDEES